MTTPSTMGSILRRLHEKIIRAEATAKQSSAISVNSYGAGYDRGHADALRDVFREITGDEWCE